MAPGWEKVDELIHEQKFEAASAEAEKRLAAARSSKNEAEWTRALIRTVQLRMGLHGDETAVRFLKEQPWPEDPVHRATLDLFYAHSLVNYARSYSWEIRQRERVESKAEVDLKSWTLEQIYDAALAAYGDAFDQREVLGKLPVTHLKEFLQPNDYPPGVRGTLRDAVSYLYVQLLADTSFWSPRETNEVYRLDLPALIQGGGEGDHPLALLVAVLADLEEWHREAGDREAVLEARLERLRRLHDNFTDAEDRRLLRGDLEQRLAAFRDVPWWAMGVATLADFTRQDPKPGRLARARELALLGFKAYPKSPGGQRCQQIVREIEAPDYGLAAMASDGPRQRSIQVTHKNVPVLYFRAFAVEPRKRVEGGREPFPDGNEVRDIPRGGKPAAAWQVELAPTPDFETHTTWVVPPLDKPGVYLVVASARQDFAARGNFLVSTRLVVGDLVLARRAGRTEQEIEILALSGSGGEALAGAEVRLYRRDWRSGHQLVESQSTGADGTVRFRVEPGQSYFVLGFQGPHTAVLDPLWSPYGPGDQPEVATALLYTDRSIYRPQQTLFWKVVAYRGRRDEGRFRTLPGEAVTVTLYDLNGEAVEQKTVTTNQLGTASGQFVIPPGRPLGSWRLGARPNAAGSQEGQALVSVEEYKRPTFEVSFKEPAEPLRLNRPAKLTGEARYYFGLPVVDGEVRWRATREPVYPWWWRWWGGAPAGDAQVVAAGTVSLDADGKFEVAFTPEADERAKDGVSYRYRVTAEVTDEGGETREAETSVRLGLVSVEARIDTAAGFFRAGEPAVVTVVRTDLNGAPRPGAGTWALYELEQPATTPLPSELPLPAAEDGGYRTPGDALRPRWGETVPAQEILASWKDGAKVAGGEITHAGKEGLELKLGALEPGAYRLRYETVDDFGAKATAWRELIVAGDETPLALPAVLLVENASVRVGETARLLVHSGFPGQTLFLETYRAGLLVERRRLTAGQGSSLIEIPIRAEDRGGFGLKLLAVRGHELLQVQAAVRVPWEDRALRISFSTFRDTIRPGARETWRVKVEPSERPEDAAAETVAAELLASMYDRSLDLFAPYQPPNPLDLYPDRTAVGMSSESLGGANVSWISREDWGEVPQIAGLRPDSLRFLGNYGIGGVGQRVRYGKVLMTAPESAAQEMDVVAPSPVLQSRAVSVTADAASAAPPPPPPPPPPAPGGEAAAPVPLRSNFAETAFWQPHLLTGKDGTATIEFTVPDSVTAWSVWVHAVTEDLRSGSLRRDTRSVKDLMVRPYLPRFLREGDRADLKVVVNNASEKEMKGEVVFDILDPDSDRSLLAEFGLTPATARLPFTVAAGAGADLTFPVTAPKRVGPVAFKVTAVAGDVSDGELRPLPVLPGRLHLAQSRFAALQGKSSRTLRFADLEKDADPTRIDEQLVVTLDAQLFYSVLSALPYLVDYPYECTEQTLNRFLSTGIAGSLFDEYPAVARMAAEMAKRDTRLETWDGADPNRKMALEETPWLNQAQGGRDEGYDLVKVLDPKIARAERDASLAKLRKAQLPSGAFPWWPGGPPDLYMTVYILYGFAKAAEFGIDVPRDVVEKGWNYVATEYRQTWQRRLAEEKDCGCEVLTFLNYVASAYPDPSWMGEALTEKERKAILDHSFRRWRQHSPYLKGLLALTLKRMGRPDDARLVFDSVMDSAKTTEDEGTFWQPEDRAWLWYNDTIETHAYALRTLTELRPDDPRRHGLVQWLFLNKKLNHWKSTRATAEVLYSLVHYLEKEGQLGVREAATVKVGGQTTSFTFEPDRYTGKKNQVVVPGEKIDPARSAVTVEKETPGLLFASATWHFSTEELPQEGSGDLFAVSRRYFQRVKTEEDTVLRPLAEGTALKPGDEIEVQLSIRSRSQAEYVHLRDPRPAGFEPAGANSGYRWDLGIFWYEETRDSGTNFFFENLPAGEYTLKYRVRANLGGTFRAGPATLQSMYAPEFTAYSAGEVVRVGIQ